MLTNEYHSFDTIYLMVFIFDCCFVLQIVVIFLSIFLLSLLSLNPPCLILPQHPNKNSPFLFFHSCQKGLLSNTVAKKCEWALLEEPMHPNSSNHNRLLSSKRWECMRCDWHRSDHSCRGVFYWIIWSACIALAVRVGVSIFGYH